jgi:hypothetical protein
MISEAKSSHKIQNYFEQINGKFNDIRGGDENK